MKQAVGEQYLPEPRAAEMAMESFATRVTVTEKIIYGVGAAGASMAWNLVTGFLVFYYSDVVGLSLATVGTLVLVTRVLDAIADPVAGIFVDRTRSRWGKARPYLIFLPLPFAVLLGLTFAVPNGTAFEMTVYAVVTFTILGLLYSFFYVPFGALLPTMARTQSDKIGLGSARAIGIATGSIIVYALALPLVKLLGGGSQAVGFTATASLIGAVCVTSLLLVFLVCRERPSSQTEQVDASPDRWNWLGNQLWRVEMVISFSLFIRLGITTAGTAYYAKAVLGDTDLTSFLLPLSAVAPLLASISAPVYLKHLGIKWGNIAALTLSVVCYLLLPLLASSLTLFSIVFFVANLSVGIMTASLFVIFADACDLQEHRDGTRKEGLLGSTSSFSAKVGMAVGGAILAFALSLGGYDPEEPTRTAQAVSLMYWLAPAIVCVAQAYFMLFYKSSDVIIQSDSA